MELRITSAIRRRSSSYPSLRDERSRRLQNEELVNAYDNAVLYTDFFLSKVIELPKPNDDAFETAMLYVSDHGESLGENSPRTRRAEARVPQ